MAIGILLNLTGFLKNVIRLQVARSNIENKEFVAKVAEISTRPVVLKFLECVLIFSWKISCNKRIACMVYK